MRAVEAVAGELRRRGLKYVFGIPGKESLRLGLELERRGVMFVSARHETQAVMMADGYWRASGELGVVLVAQGAGLANAVGGLACAARARSGVVVISGDLLRSDAADDPRAKALRSLKGVDPRTLCEAVDVAYVRPSSAATIVADVRRALDLAQSGRAVSVVVPSDLFSAPVADDRASATLGAAEVATAAENVGHADTATADPEAVEAAAELLTSWSGSHPVIVAGRGALRAGAVPALRRLGERTGALLGTTLPARSAFRGDPFAFGVCGTFSTPIATKLLQQADSVLVFGASLNPFTTYGRTIFPKKARVVHVDADAGALGKHLEPDLAVNADARAFAECLDRELERRAHRATGFRTADVATRIAAYDPRTGFAERSENGYIDPRTLMIELNEMLPRERGLVIDAGLHLHYACMFLEVERPEDFVFPIDSLAVGLGLGAAIGAAFARPERTTVLEVGDCGLMMSLGDLETAIRHKLPLVVVVSNDQAWGAEAQHLRMLGEPETFVRYTTPSFAEIARAMGGEGRTVTSPAELRALAPRLRERPLVPLVLDCRVHPDIQPESFNFDYAGVFAK